MTAQEVLPWITGFAGVAFALRGLEVFLLSRRSSFRRVWSDKNLKDDFEQGLPLPNLVARKIFSRRSLSIVAVLQIACAVTLALAGSSMSVGGLLLTHLFIAMRFRGAYNGGSDMMGFVVLSALLIALLPNDPRAPFWGTSYLAVHGLWSYLKAGLVKLRENDWRSGLALPVFLSRSVRPWSATAASFFERRPMLARLGGWAVIAFELSAPLWVFVEGAVLPAAFLAVLFHLLNAVVFGLHHFFWIWLACWPAIFALASLFGAGR